MNDILNNISSKISLQKVAMKKQKINEKIKEIEEKIDGLDKWKTAEECDLKIKIKGLDTNINRI